MAVDRCTCKNVPFAQLKELADQRSETSLLDLANETGCGTGCGLCIPYIRLMLETGQTNLPVLTREEYRRLAAEV